MAPMHMCRGRPPTPVVLTDDERQALTSLARRSRTAPQQAWRARIILACADGQPTTEIARRLHLSATTVCKWRTRFLADRLDGLADEPRPGAPRRITDAQVEDVVVRTLESTPPGATHWSTRGMAKACGLSHTTVSRIWRTFGLQPHRTETFKLSPDPQLIDKVRDIVGLYINPPEHAVVFCVDEKPQIQALERTAPLLPMQPGRVERRSFDYRRHGTTSLFAAPTFLAESGGALVRGTDDPAASSRRPSQRRLPGTGDSGVPRSVQRRRPAVRLDEDGGRNPGPHRPFRAADARRARRIADSWRGSVGRQAEPQGDDWAGRQWTVSWTTRAETASRSRLQDSRR